VTAGKVSLEAPARAGNGGVLERVQRTVEAHALLPPGEVVVIGVSGGPDSLCLLHVLHRLASLYHITLHVAHLDHQIRGAEAEADAAFVADLAAAWGLPCTIVARDVPAIARARKLALEEAARRVRYVFLAEVAARVGSHTVAVAHNADDQVESVVMHWLRGSGLAGLRGMLPLTPLGHYRLLDQLPGGERRTIESVRLIRPLLEVTRLEVESYCATHRLQPRFDRSNLDTTYYRNRLRHELLPYLERYNPNIQEVIRRMARVIADDYDLLRREMERAWPEVVLSAGAEAITFDLAGWRALPRALQRATLREAVHRLRRSLRDIDFVHIENALAVLLTGETGAQATLPQGLTATLSYETFQIADEDYEGPRPDLPLLFSEEPLPLAIPGVTLLPGSAWCLEAKVLDRAAVDEALLASTAPWEAYLDYGAAPALRLRTRRPGDRFQPLGMGGRGKRLNEFMINEKIPAAWRDAIPLLVSGDCIVWVCGYRPDERARVTAATAEVLYLRFLRQLADVVEGDA
jgi:tRNA(Ile)-lysidine synthase